MRTAIMWFITILAFLFISVVSLGREEINESNWINHPEIKEIRKIYNGIEIGIKRKELPWKAYGADTIQEEDSNQGNRIYYKNSDDLSFISLLYPNNTYINKENDEGWTIYSKSQASFTYRNKEYVLITWNELHHPGVETQMEHYNYGGILIIQGNHIVYSNYDKIPVIERVISTSRKLYIIFSDSINNRGYEESSLYVTEYVDNSLDFIYTIPIKDSDLGASGTYHNEAEIGYCDLNGDGITDIRIRYYSYEVTDFELTGKRRLIETKNIILE